MTDKAGAAINPNGQDIRPLVAGRSSNRGLWLFGGVLVLGAAGLFSALEARRQAIVSPATAIPVATGNGRIEAPAPLAIPGNGAAYDDTSGIPGIAAAPRISALPGFAPNQVPQTLPGVPRTPRVVQPTYLPGPPTGQQQNWNSAPVFAPQPSTQAPPALPRGEDEDGDNPKPASGSLAGGRARAGRLANPSTTVPQGAVIQTVLETALDSNRPGFVRAIVSRDVRSFDGTRVLIPRGSRLFGEYKADLARGQNRAFIQWQRLTRPDGVQIMVDSPAADPLGRAGVGGKVNSHFFERFSGAILQSALDVGVGLATRSATNGTVVLGLPGSTQSITGNNQENLRPTLKVKHGTMVSVFVARDLDFTTVEP